MWSLIGSHFNIVKNVSSTISVKKKSLLSLYPSVLTILKFDLKGHWRSHKVTFFNLMIRFCDMWMSQLYKNRFCGLGLTPVVSDDIRSKGGTFDWLTAKYWVGCLQEAFNVYNNFVIPKTPFVIQFWLFRHIKIYHG